VDPILTLLKVLQAVGPVSTPAVFLLCLGIWYLLKVLEKMEKRAIAAEQDAIALRERRAAELSGATKAMGEFGETMRRALERHDDRIGDALRALRRRD
jgi:hypothetical protein